MQIRELLEAAGELPSQTAQQPQAAAEPEPTAKDVEDVQALLGTIDVTKEQPESLLNKLTGWMRTNPILDKATDIMPQTRLVKAIAAAVDSIEAGDNKGALASLASGLTGGIGKAVGTVNTALNTGAALAQGDVRAAALAAGGNVGKLAKGVGAAQSLAQGDVAGAVSNVNKTAGTAVNALQQKLAPAQQTAQAKDPEPAAEDRELARLRELAYKR